MASLLREKYPQERAESTKNVLTVLGRRKISEVRFAVFAQLWNSNLSSFLETPLWLHKFQSVFKRTAVKLKE